MLDFEWKTFRIIGIPLSFYTSWIPCFGFKLARNDQNIKKWKSSSDRDESSRISQPNFFTNNFIILKFQRERSWTTSGIITKGIISKYIQMNTSVLYGLI